jgi:hypothetical protein
MKLKQFVRPTKRATIERLLLAGRRGVDVVREVRTNPTYVCRIARAMREREG